MAKKKKSIFKFIILLIFLAVVIGVPLYFLSWWWKVSEPVNPDDKEKEIFVVPKGYGVGEIGQALFEEGLIKHRHAFKIMVVKEGIAKDLQAGDFRLSPSMNLFEIAQSLTHGTLDVWVTIPEGLRREEVAQKLVEAFSEYNAEFPAKEFLQETESIEGYLFPDTYLVPKDASVLQTVQILRNTFDQKVQDELKLKANRLGLTFQQALILASLVEREAKHDKDRPIIAGILLKRLKKDWPLEVDASIQYAVGTKNCGAKLNCKWWPILEDTNFESSYNTYQNKGLPPTPICNPSLSSIQAALVPRQTDHWFYLSDKSGNIHYAETLEEHEENIETFLETN